jgi:hypothetical protein
MKAFIDFYNSLNIIPVAQNIDSPNFISSRNFLYSKLGVPIIFLKDLDILDKINVNAWDLIQANSGGHKCITNISGLNYLGRGKRPPQGKYKYDSEKEDSPMVKFTKMVATEFEKILKEKIKGNKSE